MAQNHQNDFFIVPSEQARVLLSAAWVGMQVLKTQNDLLTVAIRRLPEGVWLASSDDLPGLIVETETREEAIDLSRDLALDLLEIRGQRPDRDHQKFAFIFS